MDTFMSKICLNVFWMSSFIFNSLSIYWGPSSAIALGGGSARNLHCPRSSSSRALPFLWGIYGLRDPPRFYLGPMFQNFLDAILDYSWTGQASHVVPVLHHLYAVTCLSVFAIVQDTRSVGLCYSSSPITQIGVTGWHCSLHSPVLTNWRSCSNAWP